MVRFSLQALIGYAFDFREHGYPLWPLFGLAVCFAFYVRLRPARKRDEATPVDPPNVDHAFLLLILAVVSSAFLLDKRGQDPLTLTYFLHLSVLTFFLLLLPYIISYSFRRGRAFVAAVSTLVLMFFLVDGTVRDPEPVIAYLQEAKGYDTAFPAPEPGTESGPIAIIPPSPGKAPPPP